MPLSPVTPPYLCLPSPNVVATPRERVQQIRARPSFQQGQQFSFSSRIIVIQDPRPRDKCPLTLLTQKLLNTYRDINTKAYANINTEEKKQDGSPRKNKRKDYL